MFFSSMITFSSTCDLHHLHPSSSLPSLKPFPLLCAPQVQYSAYVGVGGLLSVAKLLCGGLLFWVLVKFSLGRKLLTTVLQKCIP